MGADILPLCTHGKENTMSEYKLAKSTDDVRNYLKNADFISFDFETASNDEYREEPMAAIDPHKSHIVGISFSVKAGTEIDLGANASTDAFKKYLYED